MRSHDSLLPGAFPNKWSGDGKHEAVSQRTGCRWLAQCGSLIQCDNYSSPCEQFVNLMLISLVIVVSLAGLKMEPPRSLVHTTWSPQERTFLFSAWTPSHLSGLLQNQQHCGAIGLVTRPWLKLRAMSLRYLFQTSLSVDAEQ